jgi:hypothetical protein
VSDRATEQVYPFRQNDYVATSGVTIREYFAVTLLASVGGVKLKQKDPDTQDGMEDRARWAVAQADILVQALEGALGSYQPAP